MKSTHGKYVADNQFEKVFVVNQRTFQTLLRM